MTHGLKIKELGLLLANEACSLVLEQRPKNKVVMKNYSFEVIFHSAVSTYYQQHNLLLDYKVKFMISTWKDSSCGAELRS